VQHDADARCGLWQSRGGSLDRLHPAARLQRISPIPEHAARLLCMLLVDTGAIAFLR